MKYSRIISVLFAAIVLVGLAASSAFARHYDPKTGRFLQRDPIKEDKLGNPYTYVSNSPINKVDPSGSSEEDVHNDMTANLAERAGFSKEEAKQIGFETNDVDYRSETSPWRDSATRELYHSMVSGDEDQLALQLFQLFERAKADIKQRRPESTIRFRAVAEYLHALEDSYTHKQHTGSSHVWSSAWAKIRLARNPDVIHNHPDIGGMREKVFRALVLFNLAIKCNVKTGTLKNIHPLTGYNIPEGPKIISEPKKELIKVPTKGKESHKKPDSGAGNPKANGVRNPGDPK